jgi:putative tryptophan/tyrosine transport system substrate-binding protein
MIRRREFITLLGGAAVAWPLAARAQQPAMPVVGLLESGSPQVFAHLVAAVSEGLRELGYVEGQNVAIEYRWGEGQYQRLPELLADLIARKVAVIVTTGGTATALAAKSATSTIPVVFAIGGDPVRFGLVASLNRPGSNITGVSFLSNTLVAKRIELLDETIPRAARIGFLVNPANPNAEADTAAAKQAVSILPHELLIVSATMPNDLDRAFRTLIAQQSEALVVFPDALFTSSRDRIVEFAARHMLPTIYSSREYIRAGGLMSYGADQTDAYRLAGAYAARILKGEKPAELPVQQSTKIELVLNLKTAKALGLTFPITLLGRADEVIE